MENTEELSQNVAKLLVRTRLDLENEFTDGRKKKSVLWGKVLTIMKEHVPDLDLSREQLSRKFINLLTTYKRIKKRNTSSGRSSTHWEFFEVFDEVYGTRHSINPPREHLQMSIQEVHVPESSSIADISMQPASPASPTPSRRRRTVSEPSETLQFLKEEAKKEEERHKEIVQIEREKIMLERERIDVMNALKDTLQKLIDK